MRKLRFSRLLTGLCLIILSFSLYAKNDIKVAVKLLKIDALKTSERMGDELYFSISEYSSSASPKLLRVPMFPLHWLSSELSNLSDVTLWEGTIKENDSVMLILTLLEQDLPPWNADDHIGSVQVKLANKESKIVAVWGQPKFKDQPKVIQPDSKVPKFMMFGDGSEYALVFHVTNYAANQEKPGKSK